MEESNGSALLYLFPILLGCLGMTIYRSMKCTGETEVTTKPGICKLNLEFISEGKASLGVALSLSVPLTFPGVQLIRAQLFATSVTFDCGRTVLHGIKLPRAPTTTAVMSGVIGPITTWMVGLINNVYVEIPLVVWVVGITLVVWVATLGALFGLLPSTTNFFLGSLIASICLSESFMISSTCL